MTQRPIDGALSLKVRIKGRWVKVGGVPVTRSPLSGHHNGTYFLEGCQPKHLASGSAMTKQRLGLTINGASYGVHA